MSRFPKPFFRPARCLWYVQLAGKQINLGPDRDAAFERYHELMTDFRRRGHIAPTSPSPPLFVVEVIDKFLDWVHIHRSPDTFEWYRYRLQRFAEKHRTLTISDLRPYHVQEWVDGYRLSQTSRRNYLRTMKRCMQWALRQGYIEKHPLQDLEVPAGERRETTVSDDEFAAILEATREDSFRDLLIVTWETGCRPQESLRVESRHVDAVHQRWVFPKSESKTKKGVRVVYMTPTAWQIVERLVNENPIGPLFRNSYGDPWSTEAVNNAFGRIRERIGKKRLTKDNGEIPDKELRVFIKKLSKVKRERGKVRAKTDSELLCEARRKLRLKRLKRLVPCYSLYALRHAWATRALQRGVDPLTTAILMGHSDPSMLAKVYQHLSLNPQHLQSQACRVTEVDRLVGK